MNSATVSSPTSHLQDWSTADEIDQFRRAFGTFCQKIAELSDASPPPGVNAANGHFRDSMVNNQNLSSLVPPRAKPVDQDGLQLYQLIATFEQGLRGAFAPENHKASALTSGKLFVQALEKFGKDAGGIISDVVKIVSLNPSEMVGAIADLAKKVQDLIQKIKASGIRFDGTNANGWIATNVAGVSKGIQVAAADLKPQLKCKESQAFCDTITQVAEKISGIPAYDNDPWLYAEWQVQFQTIMAAAALGFLS